MTAKPLVLHPDALDELKSAVVWYAERWVNFWVACSPRGQRSGDRTILSSPWSSSPVKFRAAVMLWFKNNAAMQATLKTIREQVQNPLRLDLKLQSPPLKPRKLKITSDIKGLELAYPERIQPCLRTGEVPQPK